MLSHPVLAAYRYRVPGAGERRVGGEASSWELPLASTPAIDVIKAIPATWDETRVLPGSAIGELASLARRKGDSWFIGVLGGNGARRIRLPLAFAGRPAYRAVILSDNPDRPDALRREERPVHPTDTLDLALSPGGGAVIRLEPTPDYPGAAQ